MELKIFKKNGEYWTRFKVGIKEIKYYPSSILIALGEPVRKSSRFYYWEKKGDFLNNREIKNHE